MTPNAEARLDQGHSVLRSNITSTACWRCSAKCSRPSAGLKPSRRNIVRAVLRKAASACARCRRCCADPGDRLARLRLHQQRRYPVAHPCRPRGLQPALDLIGRSSPAHHRRGCAVAHPAPGRRSEPRSGIAVCPGVCPEPGRTRTTPCGVLRLAPCPALGLEARTCIPEPEPKSIQ
jgi:hypothetical protein